VHRALASDGADKGDGRRSSPEYVPEPAQPAVLDKPRRLGDDLMFRTKRGRQFRQESLHRWWTPVRAAFMAQLPAGHHLHQRVAIDDEDRMDFCELRHFGASYMLNVLGLEPWVIAERLRHSDGGILIVKLHGPPVAGGGDRANASGVHCARRAAAWDCTRGAFPRSGEFRGTAMSNLAS
jgi:hypothetical protein